MSVEDTYRLLFLEISLKPTDLKKFILKVLSLEILQYRFLIFKSSLASEDLNIKNLYCNISNDNTLSINFFKSVGFKEISKNSNLYVSSTDINYESIIQLQCI